MEAALACASFCYDIFHLSSCFLHIWRPHHQGVEELSALRDIMTALFLPVVPNSFVLTREVAGGGFAALVIAT